MLGEKAQASACKEIVQIIVKQMNSIDFNPENAKDFNQETLFSQHLLVCGLIEIGNLMSGLGTSAQNLLQDQSLNIIEAISAVSLLFNFTLRLQTQKSFLGILIYLKKKK